jgi:hypothetical protein
VEEKFVEIRWCEGTVVPDAAVAKLDVLHRTDLNPADECVQRHAAVRRSLFCLEKGDHARGPLT